MHYRDIGQRRNIPVNVRLFKHPMTMLFLMVRLDGCATSAPMVMPLPAGVARVSVDEVPLRHRPHGSRGTSRPICCYRRCSPQSMFAGCRYPARVQSPRRYCVCNVQFRMLQLTPFVPMADPQVVARQPHNHQPQLVHEHPSAISACPDKKYPRPPGCRCP